MKKYLILLAVIFVCFLGCRSEMDLLPATAWSAGCIQLAPNEDGYRLSGMCCAYAQIPKVTLTRNRTFSVIGSYYAFTGAGYNSMPLEITGYLSPDGKTLTIDYLLNSVPVTYTLSLGYATVLCYCTCN